MRRLAKPGAGASPRPSWARVIRDAAPVRVFTDVEEMLQDVEEEKAAWAQLSKDLFIGLGRVFKASGICTMPVGNLGALGPGISMVWRILSLQLWWTNGGDYLFKGWMLHV